MKIAVDARRIRDFGVGTYIRNLLTALGAAETQPDFRLIVHPSDRSYLPPLPANFEVVPYSYADTGRMEHFRFPAFLRRLECDLVHFPLNRVPLFVKKPYVVTIHDLGVLLYSENSAIWRALRNFRVQWGLRRAGKIIAVSAATKRDLLNLMGIPEPRIQLVYSAPDPDFFSRDRIPGRALAGDPEAAAKERRRILERYQIHYPFLLYAGTIRPQKNIPRLVEAFAVIRGEMENNPRYRDLRLIIIGDEISKYPAVRRAVMQSRVEQAVRFLGFVPFDTLRTFYELASAFVFPSLYEGFGLPPLEAMASGTPVIASGISAIPEAVGDAAMLVNPENVFDIARGIREVLLDDDLRAALVQRGYRHASRFSWAKNAGEVMGIYREALGEASGGRVDFFAN
ncbi:MAG: glycosyltransferase family 4 protein [Acidobacteriota bacterium]|nr:glycosyltransferase family 4 protein [Acidobacteriota bacterium]